MKLKMNPIVSNIIRLILDIDSCHLFIFDSSIVCRHVFFPSFIKRKIIYEFKCKQIELHLNKHPPKKSIYPSHTVREGEQKKQQWQQIEMCTVKSALKSVLEMYKITHEKNSIHTENRTKEHQEMYVLKKKDLRDGERIGEERKKRRYELHSRLKSEQQIE